MPSILAIDDEVEIAQFIQSALQKRGFEVTICHSAEDALTILETTHPNLIITDHNLPGQNGDELIHTLKSNEKTKDIPILMSTGQVLMKEPTGGNPRLKKPDSLLIKPYEMSELVEKINQLLNLS